MLNHYSEYTGLTSRIRYGATRLNGSGESSVCEVDTHLGERDTKGGEREGGRKVGGREGRREGGNGGGDGLDGGREGRARKRKELEREWRVTRRVGKSKEEKQDDAANFTITSTIMRIDR